MNILEAIKPFMEEIEVKRRTFVVDDRGYANPTDSTTKILGAVAMRGQDSWTADLSGIADLGSVRLYTDQNLDIGDQIIYHGQVYTITFKQDYYNLFKIYLYRLAKP